MRSDEAALTAETRQIIVCNSGTGCAFVTSLSDTHIAQCINVQFM